MTLRETLLANCYLSTGGVVAREFQLDVGEAVQRNQDIIVQAFTGSEKTLAMVILLFTYPTKFIIMASPLNNLQESMCESFDKWGLISYAYNSNVRTPAMLRELRAKRFDVLETAPESLVQPSALRPLLTDPDWTADCLAIAIDEGHCVIDWGLSGFRPAYARLSLLRSFMAHDVPFIVVSATLAPATMSALARILHFRAGFKTINLGNIRPNIFWEVRTVDGGQKTSLHYLRFLLPRSVTADNVNSIPSTIVFVPSRSMTSRVANYLRDLLPKPLSYEAVLPLHAKSKPGRISRVLQCFEAGRTRILVATTIAGLGRDFRDVQRVVGYMPPENIEAWVQEAGRGARKDTARCWALLLVPKSVFMLRKVKTELQPPAAPAIPEPVSDAAAGTEEPVADVVPDQPAADEPPLDTEELLSF
ncbi:P-loop containing nucleoside triphosphate hydrolase protein [Auricularia subglabra TFB-10046 SS5]|nr:P-loop containing nucleoside triphosphate hydrolase protein [Auricularia subglabra TFB-10046 SS5]